MKAIICPSILSGDFAILGEECERMISAGADWIHVDVMDGHFVPNITLGAPVVKSMRKHTNAYLDCHLMVSHPEQWVEDFRLAGASGFTFHLEAAVDTLLLCQRVRENGMKAGVALKPGTSVDSLFPAIDAGLVDLALIMTVEPGFGGQKFMESTMEKVVKLRARYPKLDIQVDGGLGPDTIDSAAKAGANVIVAGSSIFGSACPKETIAQLRQSVTRLLLK